MSQQTLSKASLHTVRGPWIVSNWHFTRANEENRVAIKPGSLRGCTLEHCYINRFGVLGVARAIPKGTAHVRIDYTTPVMLLLLLLAHTSPRRLSLNILREPVTFFSQPLAYFRTIYFVNSCSLGPVDLKHADPARILRGNRGCLRDVPAGTELITYPFIF